MKYVLDFEKWALEKYNQFKKIQYSNPNLVSVVSQSVRSVAIINTRNGRTGFSKCHPHDKFNISVGYAIAWARYLGEEVPKQANPTTISKLTPGDKFIHVDEIYNGMYNGMKFYYIGHDPVNAVSVAVCAASGENYHFKLNRRVIKI